MRKKTSSKTPPKLEDTSIPPVFSAAFYKILLKGAKTLGVTRAEFALQAAEHFLQSLEVKRDQDNVLVETLGSEELAKRYREANSKIAKKWWSKLSQEEKTKRARKAVEARWGKRPQ